MLDQETPQFEVSDARSVINGGRSSNRSNGPNTLTCESHALLAPAQRWITSTGGVDVAYCPRCGALDGEDDHDTPYICDECWFTEPDPDVDP